MIDSILADDRFSEDLGWLKTHWLFSFSHYYDSKNLEFGNLRVFNDDIVMPDGGFPSHAHANFEIVTIVLEGAISHKDSMGNETLVRAGEVQRMSAGRGVVHSEFNKGEGPARLYQIWFSPDVENLKPSYAQVRALPEKTSSSLILLVSGLEPAPISMSSEASLSVGFWDKGVKLSLKLGADEGAFIYLENGVLVVGDNLLKSGDQARVRGEEKIILESKTETRFVLVRTKL